MGLADHSTPQECWWCSPINVMGGVLVAYWRKHPRKELQLVLEEFDAHGWRIEDPPKYYKVSCPCGDHYRWNHLTPSNPYYGNQALRWASRTCPTCKEGRRGR